MDSDMNRALLADWLDWLQRAGRWLMVGPPLQTPQEFRRERLAAVLAVGRQLSEEYAKLYEEVNATIRRVEAGPKTFQEAMARKEES